MEEQQELDSRLNDLLQQISQVNRMIRFHREHSQDESMIQQYTQLRASFIEQMNETLKAYDLQVLTV